MERAGAPMSRPRWRAALRRVAPKPRARSRMPRHARNPCSGRGLGPGSGRRSPHGHARGSSGSRRAAGTVPYPGRAGRRSAVAHRGRTARQVVLHRPASGGADPARAPATSLPGSYPAETMGQSSASSRIPRRFNQEATLQRCQASSRPRHSPKVGGDVLEVLAA